MKIDNDEEMPAAELLEAAHQMRDLFARNGLEFAPDFETNIRTVQKNLAAEGNFMSYEETAYRVCLATLEENFTHVSELKQEGKD